MTIDDRIFQNDWDSYKSQKAITDCNKIADSLCLFLKEYLSKFHKREFTLRQINLLFGNWIYYYTQIIYDRNESIQNLDQKTSLLDENFILKPPVFDPIEFNQKCSLSDEYNNYLYQLLINLYENKIHKAKPKKFKLKYRNKLSLREWVMKLYFYLISSSSRLVISQPYLRWNEVIQMSWKIRKIGIFENFNQDFHLYYEVDFAKRIELFQNLAGNFHDNIFYKLLPILLPSCYLECYEDIEVLSKRFNSLNVKHLFTSTSLLYSNPVIRVYLSNRINIEIHNRFHGGGYRIFKNYWSERYEKSISTKCYTFGNPFKEEDQSTFLSPNISLKNIKKKKNINVLVLLSSSPKYVTGFHGYPVSSRSRKWDRETFNFLKEIQNIKLTIKLPTDLGWANEFNNQIKKIAKCKGYDFVKTQNSGIELIKKSNLVIFNAVGTGFLESLGMNIPTICIYDKDTYTFNEKFMNYVEKFKRHKIIHNSTNSICSFLDEINGDYKTWWSNEDLQKILREFQMDYYQIDIDWKKNWLNVLFSL